LAFRPALSDRLARRTHLAPTSASRQKSLVEAGVPQIDLSAIFREPFVDLEDYDWNFPRSRAGSDAALSSYRLIGRIDGGDFLGRDGHKIPAERRRNHLVRVIVRRRASDSESRKVSTVPSRVYVVTSRRS
jgi:hypothetical protein